MGDKTELDILFDLTSHCNKDTKSYFRECFHLSIIEMFANMFYNI